MYAPYAQDTYKNIEMAILLQNRQYSVSTLMTVEYSMFPNLQFKNISIGKLNLNKDVCMHFKTRKCSLILFES